MAESKTERSQGQRQGGQALARNERETRGLQSSQGGSFLSSPFELMDRMAEEMDQTFDRIFRGFGLAPRARMPRGLFVGSPARQNAWAPRIEAIQNGDRFIVRAELPGLKKDDVQVEIGENALTIHGERQEQHEDQREGYYHSERQYGQFYRTIPLPEGVIAESAQAQFRDGVLEVTMQAPPAEASRGRRLEIKDASQGGDPQR